MGRLSKFALDTYVGPFVSELTVCGARRLPKYESLMSRYVLVSIFQLPLPEDLLKLYSNYIRRIEQVWRSYNSGREHLASFVKADRGTNVSDYYVAVSHFETAVAHLNLARWLAVKFLQPKGTLLFQKEEKNFDSELQSLHNSVKHAHERLTKGKVQHELMQPIWITNKGLACVDHEVTFADLKAHIVEGLKIAKFIVRGLPIHMEKAERQQL